MIINVRNVHGIAGILAILVALSFSIVACSSQPALTISPTILNSETVISSPGSTASPSARTPQTPTPAPAVLPTPVMTPEPAPSLYPNNSDNDGAANSSGSYPFVARSGNTLFYISIVQPKNINTLFKMSLSGTKRTAILTQKQALAQLKKLNKNVMTAYPQNIQRVEDNRIYFLCMTSETLPDMKSKNEFASEYILSVDFNGKGMKVVEQILKPCSRNEWNQWRMASTYSGYYVIPEYLAPISDNGWVFITDENGELFKEKPDGSGRQLLVTASIATFALQDGWIYFEKRNEPGIFRISVNGEGLRKIRDVSNPNRDVAGFTVCGNWIYYNADDDERDFAIRKLKIDGTEDVRIQSNNTPYCFQIINGLIFYNTMKRGANSPEGYETYEMVWNLRVMNMDGTGDRTIDSSAK